MAHLATELANQMNTPPDYSSDHSQHHPNAATTGTFKTLEQTVNQIFHCWSLLLKIRLDIFFNALENGRIIHFGLKLFAGYALEQIYVSRGDLCANFII